VEASGEGVAKSANVGQIDGACRSARALVHVSKYVLVSQIDFRFVHQNVKIPFVIATTRKNHIPEGVEL
jgi:hypothetical protein